MKKLNFTKKVIKKVRGKLGAKIRKKYFKDLGVKDSLYRIMLSRMIDDDEQTVIITNNKSLIDECIDKSFVRRLKSFINVEMMKSQRKYYVGMCKCNYDYDTSNERDTFYESFFFSKIIPHEKYTDVYYLPVFYISPYNKRVPVKTADVKCVHVFKISMTDTITVDNEVYHEIIGIRQKSGYVGKSYKEIFEKSDPCDKKIYPANHDNIISVNISHIPNKININDICIDMIDEKYIRNVTDSHDDKSEVTDTLMKGVK